MRTFKMALELDFKVVVPDVFCTDMRREAQGEDATEFLLTAQRMHPTDDEAFLLHILKHGVRRHVRSGLAELFAASGLGCTLAPAKVVQDVSPELEGRCTSS